MRALHVGAPIELSQNAAGTQVTVVHDSPTLAFAMQVPPDPPEQNVSAEQVEMPFGLSQRPPAGALPTTTKLQELLEFGTSVSARSQTLFRSASVAKQAAAALASYRSSPAAM
jgi:hypothetical protein